MNIKTVSFRTAAALVAVVVTASMASCGQKKIYAGGSGGGFGVPSYNAVPDQTLPNPTAPTPEVPDAPAKTEDEICYYDDEGIEIIDTFGNSMYSVFSKTIGTGTRYGIIDMNGNVRIPAQHGQLGWCEWHEVLFNDKLSDDDAPIYIDDKYKIAPHGGHGGMFEGGRIYKILDKNSGTVYDVLWGYDGAEVSVASSLNVYSPFIVYSGDTPIFTGNYYAEYDDNGNYISPFQFYENIICNPSECGFLDPYGKQISLGMCDELPLQFSNDHIVIQRNGKYGLIDKHGNESSMIIYDDAEDAYGNMAWVKLDGKWRVINLG